MFENWTNALLRDFISSRSLCHNGTKGSKILAGFLSKLNRSLLFHCVEDVRKCNRGVARIWFILTFIVWMNTKGGGCSATGNVATIYHFFVARVTGRPSRLKRSTGLELSILPPLQLAVVIRMQISPLHSGWASWPWVGPGCCDTGCEKRCHALRTAFSPMWLCNTCTAHQIDGSVTWILCLPRFPRWQRRKYSLPCLQGLLHGHTMLCSEYRQTPNESKWSHVDHIPVYVAYRNIISFHYLHKTTI